VDGQVVELLTDAVLVGHGVALLVIYREERHEGFLPNSEVDERLRAPLHILLHHHIEVLFRTAIVRLPLD